MNIKNSFSRFCLNFCSLERHVILASHPKTGATFLHYLINNLLTNKNNFENEYSYCSTYINSPDLDMIPIFKLNNTLKSFERNPLLLKTHKHYNPAFQRVICLVRNPVNTFISRYNYESTFCNKSYKNFRSFLLSTNIIEKYKKFYQSYLESNLSTRIVFVNYEDILNKVEVIKDIIFLIYGINLEMKYINEISSKCSKYKAIAIENLYKRYDKRNKIVERNFVNNKSYLKNPDPEDIRFIKFNLDAFYKLISEQ